MKALFILLIPLFLFSCAKVYTYEYSYEIEVQYSDNKLDTIRGSYIYEAQVKYDFHCHLEKSGCIECPTPGFAACQVRTFRFLNESNTIQ